MNDLHTKCMSCAFLRNNKVLVLIDNIQNLFVLLTPQISCFIDTHRLCFVAGSMAVDLLTLVPLNNNGT